jgi:hypothetical protein
MKYLKIIVIVLIVVLVGLGAYYAFLKSRPPKSLPVEVKIADATPSITKADLITDIRDLTVDKAISTHKNIEVSGAFQIVDPVNKVINGTTYNYVLGILGSDKSLSKVWLTTEQYNQISEVIASGSINRGYPVLLTISETGVSLTGLP